MAAFDAAAAALELGDDDADLDGFVLEQVVESEPPVAWTISVEDGRVRVRSGAAAAPTVQLRAAPDTATAVAAGQESAQAAFMAGRLRISGDPTALVRARPLLTRLDTVRPDPER